jgi:hypothetical protein
VKGNITLQRDTAYKGPALSIATDSRVVILDNLKFKDFSTGIELGNTGLFLKNTQFINCKLPVQRKYDLPDSKAVNADFPATKVNPQPAKPQTTVKPNGTR